MKKYIFLTIISALIGISLAFLPENKNYSELSSEELLLKINDDTRFVSTDELAKLIIDKDPNLFLIDVRDEKAFDKFSLANAINLPLKDLLNEDNLSYLEYETKKIVFYSNGTIFSNQAWLIATRLKYPNLYILEGGLNRWVETILKPKEIDENASVNEINLYKFRKGASQYFTGSKQVSTSNKKLKKAVKKKAKKEVEGGC